ncbi:AraC family transcriptional regulator [Dongia deserti]|uniref:AraC family transcriptional regulator n=1 Tax=Dongia deserti TaxID=2268030 RepID=UPI000E65D000|nr:AraC family transcriptional regulator [Dongia deserti]
MIEAPDFLKQDEPAPGFRRLAARFHGHAYDPHRHECYAVGVTLAGVQAFHYRGAERASSTGQTMVLHPDEAHDGHAGIEDGFTYHMLYVDPALICAALDGAPPPFVREAVARDDEFAAIIAEAFEDFPNPLASMAVDATIARLADNLDRRSDRRPQRPRARHPLAAAERARQLLEETTDPAISSAELEQVTGLNRYALARAFRAAFGSSPHRYLVARRVARAQRLLAAGAGLAEAAAGAGFADQSHFTRHFKAHLGLTPGRYITLQRAA